MWRIRRGWMLVSAVVLAGGGCTTPSGRSPAFGVRPAAETAAKLPFLRDGQTTQAEIVARLGEPGVVLEEDHTWCYLFLGTASGGLRCSTVGGLKVSGRPEDPLDVRYRYELVLTFDEGGLLVRHTLIEKPLEAS